MIRGEWKWAGVDRQSAPLVRFSAVSVFIDGELDNFAPPQDARDYADRVRKRGDDALRLNRDRRRMRLYVEERERVFAPRQKSHNSGSAR